VLDVFGRTREFALRWRQLENTRACWMRSSVRNGTVMVLDIAVAPATSIRAFSIPARDLVNVTLLQASWLQNYSGEGWSPVSGRLSDRPGGGRQGFEVPWGHMSPVAIMIAGGEGLLCVLEAAHVCCGGKTLQSHDQCNQQPRIDPRLTGVVSVPPRQSRDAMCPERDLNHP
jgi:hypothetical protein